VAGSAVYPGLLSLAGAAVRATRLSLRSLQAAKIFFRPRATPFGAGFAGALSFPLENIFAARAARLPSRPITPAFLPAPEHTTDQDPATGNHQRKGA
jgi:hypothetical protein